VRIRLEGRTGPRGTVEFSVIDDGPGIPRAERARVFEKFYRPDVLVSRRSEGSGLGLAIVHGIVSAHGGSVTLDSELGRGSCFTVRLPRA
jgi:signal transduction histidine kinase